MAKSNKTFYAYQLDLHYLSSDNHATDAVKWDSSIIEQLFTEIMGLSDRERNIKYNDAWLMFLSHVSIYEHYIFGSFYSAEYGTVGELLHADSLEVRKNPKGIREGELAPTYFYIRKADGLILLQGSKRLTRSRCEEYLERLGASVIADNDLTYIQLCTMLNTGFFSQIAELNSVNNIQLEVTKSELPADENPAVIALQNDLEEISATDVKLEFVAKYQRAGMNKVIDLVRRYKQQKGVTKIIVKGKLGDAHKTVNMEESQEKYTKRVEVDTLNQPMLSSVEDALIQIASQRTSLRS
ncbi:hypothetical protein [Paenibacillus amylolyticus]|uniref:hypothetical protein n=1 Tax=Paenibacillus amylolyticus TaxID=1451 RepID=UPI003392D22E